MSSKLIAAALTLAALVLLSGRFSATAADNAPSDRLCKLFNHPLEDGFVLDTSDATSPVGAWIAGERARGWGTADVDFEVVQKGTGFPAGYVQVCLKR